MTRIDPHERKDVVLTMVVQRYVQTVEPVSSAFIAEEYDKDISSATIRNILAELEAEGFLMHPHTSSGRVPTERGYRYYVDFLMKEELRLLEEERQRIQNEYHQGIKELQNLMEKTSRVMAGLTQCASIVTLDGFPQAYACRGTDHLMRAVGSQSVQKMAAILKALEEKERVLDVIQRDLSRKTKIYIGQETSCDAFEDCSMAVSRFKTQMGPSGRIAVLGPTRMNYQRVVAALEYVADVIEENM